MLLNIPLAGRLELPEGRGTPGEATSGRGICRVITFSLFLRVCLADLTWVRRSVLEGVSYLFLFSLGGAGGGEG